MPARRKSTSSKRVTGRTRPRIDIHRTDLAQPDGSPLAGLLPAGLPSTGPLPDAPLPDAPLPDAPPSDGPPPATGPVRGSWQAPRARGAVQARRYAFRRS